jgi:7-cyano-7-deazaguanine synthase
MQEHHIKNNNNALVLYSAGLDSTYNLFKAIEKYNIIKILFFKYYQKAYTKEHEKVSFLSKYLNIELIKINLDFYKTFKSSIIDKNSNIPKYNISNTSINKVINFDDELNVSLKNKIIKSKPSEWVANRNSIMLNIAAAYAENFNFKNIVIGINKEEARNFPDNSINFLKTINQLFKYATFNKVKVSSFSAELDKKSILKKLSFILKENNLSYDIIWSCYNNLEKMCGICQSCVRLKNAIINNKLGGLCQDLFLA